MRKPATIKPDPQFGQILGANPGIILLLDIFKPPAKIIIRK
jgi:hypothetical protein